MKYKKKVLRNIFKRVVGAMSGQAIEVALVDNAQPHYNTELKTIETFTVVPYAQNDEEDFLIGRGIIIHEASHVLFAPSLKGTVADLEAEGYDTKAVSFRPFYELCNVFLDINNEFKTTEVWPHLKSHLRDKTEIYITRRPKILKTDNPFLQILLRCDKLCHFKPKYPDGMHKDLIKYVDKIVKQFDQKEIHKCDGAKLLKFTEYAYKEWVKLNENSKKKYESITNKIIEKSQNLGKAISEKDSKGIEQLTKEIEELKKQEKPIKVKDEFDEQNLVRLSDSNADGDYVNTPLEELKERLKQSGEKINAESGTAWGCGEPSNNVTDLSVDEMNEGKLRVPPAIDYAKAKDIGTKIKRHLMNRVKLQEDFEKKHRTGAISIEEIRTQISRNGRLVNENLFQRKNTFSRGGEWIVSVLVDCSGSMGDSKMQQAKQALQTLCYAFKGIPNLKYELIGFSTQGCDPVNITIKPLNRTKVNIDPLMACDGNMDGMNILSAVKRLKTYSRQKKVMIVISDGQPAYQNGIDETKKAVELAESRGIKVIGIGIEGAVEHVIEEIYPTNYMFKDITTLPLDLANLILNALKSTKKHRFVRNKWEI